MKWLWLFPILLAVYVLLYLALIPMMLLFPRGEMAEMLRQEALKDAQ